jgi:hypothetical protein
MNAEDKGRWWVVGSAWEGRIDKVEGKCQSSLGHWWVVGSAWEGRTDQPEGKCQRSSGHWWVIRSLGKEEPIN